MHLILLVSQTDIAGNKVSTRAVDDLADWVVYQVICGHGHYYSMIIYRNTLQVLWIHKTP